MKRETRHERSSANAIGRRTFIKTGAAAAGAAAMPDVALAEEPRSAIVVVHGTDIAKMVEAGMARMGGWDKFFKPGTKVALKPNIAWNSTPEQGGNTHPDIIRAFVLAAEARKVKQVAIPENTCHPEKKTFVTSGVRDALKGTGAKLYRPKPADYRPVAVPKGRICKEAKVAGDLLDADCLVNMPVAKHHGGATLSLSMKNWMGAIDNSSRRSWHRNGLHQCIADFSTFLKPTLVVIDATRIMLDNGPQGPGRLAHPHEIIFATDPVAADTYAASLFKKTPKDVPHIGLAAELGVGCADIAKIKVERIEA
ncbi:MAG: DUF362 domain-containing protein [Kiritimatiellae bacterium]|nr:DUF362 domain-containing protein [Kiritimatiellia bacterium]